MTRILTLCLVVELAANTGVVSSDRSAYHWCRMHNCFDYSRCSLFSPFLIYFYHPDDEDIDDTNDSGNKQESKISSDFQQIRSQIVESFNGNTHVTFDPTVACIYVVIMFDNRNVKDFTAEFLNHYFHSLPFWAGIQTPKCLHMT